MISKQILDKVIKDSHDVCHRYYRARAEYENKAKEEKRLLAELASKQEAKSEAERARLAQADTEYKEYLDELYEANQEFRKAQASFDNLNIQLDAARSLNAISVAEMKLI